MYLIITVFKIFALEEDGLVEKANLRAGKHLNLNFSCNDVVWNPVEGENLYVYVCVCVCG